jgi:integrase
MQKIGEGMRRGEVAGVRWADVDFDGERLRVAQSIVPVAGKPEIGSTKTGRVRWIDLDEATLAALRAHRARQNEARLRCGAGYQDGLDLVFARKDGSPIDPSHLSHAFARHAVAAGLPKIRLHDLRHSVATLCIESGESLKAVADRLGHAQETTTLAIYAHVSPKARREMANNIAASIDG